MSLETRECLKAFPFDDNHPLAIERDRRTIAPRVVYRVYRTDRRDVCSDILRIQE